MVSCHFPLATLRENVGKFKGGNITNCFEKRTNIAQDQFVVHIVKFGLTMEFAEVSLYQFLPISLFWKLKILMQKFTNFSVKLLL